MPGRTDNDIKNYRHVHLKKKLGKVNSCGVEGKQNFEDYKHYDDVATIGGLDYIKAYYDKMCKNAIVVNSITTQQNNQEKAIGFTNKRL